MAYPGSFYRVVLGGSIYSEKWNTSLNYFAGFLDKPADASILATVASATSAFYSANGSPTGVGFVAASKLEYVKVNRINTAGHYQDPNPMTHDYPSAIVGTGTIQNVAPQLTPVVSLLTAFDRGLANKGRMYLPPAAGFWQPGADGRATAADAARIATAVASYINQINAAFDAWAGAGDAGYVAIMSNRGAGAQHQVTKTATGRVIDTMRSRRSSLAEDYQPSTIAIAT